MNIVLRSNLKSVLPTSQYGCGISGKCLFKFRISNATRNNIPRIWNLIAPILNNCCRRIHTTIWPFGSQKHPVGYFCFNIEKYKLTGCEMNPKNPSFKIQLLSVYLVDWHVSSRCRESHKNTSPREIRVKAGDLRWEGLGWQKLTYLF